MKSDIENYGDRAAQVIAVRGNTVTAWVGDDSAAMGQTLWVGEQRGRVARLAGDRTVDAVFFDASAITVGNPARPASESANFPGAVAGTTAVETLRFVTAPPTPSAAPADRGRIATGLRAIDEWTPLVRGGVNLVLDGSSDPGAFQRLVANAADGATCVGALPSSEGWDLSHVITYDASHQADLARDVARQWATELGCPLVLSVDTGFDLDEFADGLAITLFVRVALDDGLEVIAESLDVGEADCQIVVGADGDVEFARSHSRLGEGAHESLFFRAAELNDTVALFGRDELDPEDRELLDRLDSAQRVLQDAPTD